MSDKETIQEIPPNHLCPWCERIFDGVGSKTYAGYEGSFVSCGSCGAIFANITVGAQFTIGEPMKACTVYEIEAIQESSYDSIVTCREIAKVRCSALDKPNKNYVTYFSREHVLSAMRGHYREGLV